MSRTTLLMPLLAAALLAGCQARPGGPSQPVTFKDDSYTGPDPGKLPSSLLTTSEGRGPTGSTRAAAGGASARVPQPSSRFVSTPPSRGSGAPLDPNVLNTLLNTMNGNPPGRLVPHAAMEPTATAAAPTVAVPAPRTPVTHEALVPAATQTPRAEATPDPAPSAQVGGQLHRPETPFVATSFSKPATATAPLKANATAAVTFSSGMSPTMAARMRAVTPPK